ncbi:MAG: hypothetical protein WAQ99_22115 [Pyrinomonadaceae bacterium]
MPQGFDVYFDDIREGIAKNGTYQIEWSILLNTVFRSDASKPSPQAQLDSWVRENNFRYEWAEKLIGKKNVQLITFYRG